MIRVLCIFFIIWILYNYEEGFTTINQHRFYCPDIYRKNISEIEQQVKKTQYGGYTSNEYLDMTRFVSTESEPLPVNPDFFI